MAVITGSGSNDTLVGTSGDDQIYGLGGNDSLSGGAGNDVLDGGTGADTMTGGSGNDVYHVDDAGDVVVENAGGGTDTVRITISSYTLGANVEHLDARNVTAASMTLTGNGLSNIFYMGVGAVTVSAGAGSDTASYVDTGAVVVDLVSGVHGGEAADDSLTSIENLTGSQSADELYGTGSANVLDGSGGADTLVGRGGNDTYVVDDAADVVTELAGEGTDEVRTALALYTLGANVEKLRFTGTGLAVIEADGNALNNEMYGGANSDTLRGLAGNDLLDGRGGDDFLYGGLGHDTLLGGTGVDFMAGGDGNDFYYVDHSADTVEEAPGEGTDTVNVSSTFFITPADVEIVYYNGPSEDFYAEGNELDNVIEGGSGNDSLYGLSGDDTIRGKNGDDTIAGNDGNDVLIAGGGADIIEGGLDADTFVIGYFDTGLGAGADRITDFEIGSDLIDISSWDADMWTSGDQAFAFIGSDPFSGVAGELRSYFDGTDTYVEGDNSGDGIADFEFILSGYVPVTASDFLL